MAALGLLLDIDVGVGVLFIRAKRVSNCYMQEKKN